MTKLSTTIYKDELFAKYLRILGDPHLLKNDPLGVKSLDFNLRTCIGKTDNIKISLCSHATIIQRETKGKICRVCLKNLEVVAGRINDYLILRHSQCKNPICFNCAESNPDKFYLAFKKGLEKYNLMKNC